MNADDTDFIESTTASSTTTTTSSTTSLPEDNSESSEDIDECESLVENGQMIFTHETTEGWHFMVEVPTNIQVNVTIVPIYFCI